MIFPTHPSLFAFVRFLLVGTLNTVVTLGVIFLGSHLGGWSYGVANGAGYAVGIVHSYFWNRHWAFSAGSSLGSLPRFLIVTALTYLVQFGALVGLKEGLRVPIDVSQLVAMVVYTAVGFGLHRHFTFQEALHDR